jgi:hypothetical protein
MRTVCGFLVVMLLPVAAIAQTRAFAVSERPAAGVFLGSSANGDHNSNDSSAEIGFVFDAPVVFGYRVRADVSRVAWGFEERDYLGSLRVRDTVTLKSLRLGLLRVRHLGPRIAGYTGGGYGAYRYEYERTPVHNPWRGGLHGVAGLEILSAGRSYGFDGEVRFHAIHGTGQPPVFSYALFKLDAAVGMKVRF